MNVLTINLENNINNASLQVGDVAYYVDNFTTTTYEPYKPAGIKHTSDSPERIGKIVSKSINSITINDPDNTPPVNAFIMFLKDRSVNNTSLLGYYAEVKLNNNSTEKAELFALNPGITASSK